MGPPRIARAELGLDLQTHPTPALKTLPNKFSSPLATPTPPPIPKATPNLSGLRPTLFCRDDPFLWLLQPPHLPYQVPTSFVRIPVVGSHSGSDPTTALVLAGVS